MGAVPIAFGWGAGASVRRPLGVVVVGGLAFSQLVTLYVTPVFYTYFDELQTWFAARAAARRQRRESTVVPGHPGAGPGPLPLPAGD
jgi:HAE1 family hydrophobic/amphiphilic exporter-1